MVNVSLGLQICISETSLNDEKEAKTKSLVTNHISKMKVRNTTCIMCGNSTVTVFLFLPGHQTFSELFSEYLVDNFNIRTISDHFHHY